MSHRTLKCARQFSTLPTRGCLAYSQVLAYDVADDPLEGDTRLKGEKQPGLTRSVLLLFLCLSLVYSQGLLYLSYYHFSFKRITIPLGCPQIRLPVPDGRQLRTVRRHRAPVAVLRRAKPPVWSMWPRVATR